MNRIVFDIESLAIPFEEFDHTSQEYLMKYAKNDDERSDALRRMNLNPLTARIIAIAMVNPDSNQGKVLYSAPAGPGRFSDDGLIEFEPCDEEGIIGKFWETITHYNQIITFNGRSFDCPFVLLRSALAGIRPTKNLLPYRYSAREHCDLLDQLTFYGAIRKFNLDFYCKSFGIKSPKEGGVTGLDMGLLFNEGRFMEIAEYCLGDVKATVELFNRWQAYLNLEH